jgi:hypothetical protein
MAKCDWSSNLSFKGLTSFFWFEQNKKNLMAKAILDLPTPLDFTPLGLGLVTHPYKKKVFSAPFLRHSCFILLPGKTCEAWCRSWGRKRPKFSCFSM